MQTIVHPTLETNHALESINGAGQIETLWT